jgi:hypothetical protein
MTPLEAAVWIIGILTVGGTISNVAKSFSRANETMLDVSEWFKEQQEKREKNERQDDPEGR